MSRRWLTEALGWYGVIAILAAYTLVSFSIIDANSRLFQALNLTGALGIIADSLPDKNWQPIILNIVWALIAVFALSRVIF